MVYSSSLPPQGLGPVRQVEFPGDLETGWVVKERNSRPLRDCMEEGKQKMISESSV